MDSTNTTIKRIRLVMVCLLSLRQHRYVLGGSFSGKLVVYHRPSRLLPIQGQLVVSYSYMMLAEGKALAVLSHLVEGCSIRSTERLIVAFTAIPFLTCSHSLASVVNILKLCCCQHRGWFSCSINGLIHTSLQRGGRRASIGR